MSTTLTDEQRRVLLFMAVGTVRKLKDALATASSNLRNAYKAAKADGVGKKDIDDFIRLSGMDVQEVVNEQRRLGQIAMWAGHGVQMSFDLEDKPLEVTEQRGFAAGAAGEPLKAPEELSGRFLQAYNRGWHKGTAGREEMIRDRTERELAAENFRNALDGKEPEKAAPAPAEAGEDADRDEDGEERDEDAEEGEDAPADDDAVEAPGEEREGVPAEEEVRRVEVPVTTGTAAGNDDDEENVDESKVAQLLEEKAKRARRPRTARGRAAAADNAA